MNKLKIEKTFFVLFLCVAIVCLTFASGLLINTGCKKHDPVYYTVTFDTNGGSKIDAIEVESGSLVKKPDDPTRENFVFNGWVKYEGSAQVEFNFAEAITGNLTLYAKWKTPEPSNPSNPSDPSDPSNPSNPSDPSDPSNPSNPSDPSDPSNPSNPSDPSDPSTPEVTKYTVTFDLDGGTAAVTKVLVESGKKAAEPENPTKDGYDFNGWVDAQGKAFDFANTAITSDITIKATWEVKHFTVTFDVAGGNETINSQSQKKGEKAVRPADPTKNGHTFAGWYLGDTAYNFDAPVTADITLVAHWTANGGTTPTEPVATPHTFTYDYSKITNPPADKATLTQANFTGDNSFLTISNGVSYRHKDTTDSKSPNCIENKDGGISVTFKGTGTITISFASTGTKNTSSLELRDASGKAVIADSSANGTNGVYEVSGTTATTLTFTITEAGVYTIYCHYDYIDDKNEASSRGARITGITMVDNYVDNKE